MLTWRRRGILVVGEQGSPEKFPAVYLVIDFPSIERRFDDGVDAIFGMTDTGFTHDRLHLMVVECLLCGQRFLTPRADKTNFLVVVGLHVASEAGQRLFRSGTWEAQDRVLGSMSR